VADVRATDVKQGDAQPDHGQWAQNFEGSDFGPRTAAKREGAGEE
jgi:hypothetical protein